MNSKEKKDIQCIGTKLLSNYKFVKPANQDLNDWKGGQACRSDAFRVGQLTAAPYTVVLNTKIKTFYIQCIESFLSS